MKATIERTDGRMTDMYVLRMHGLRGVRQRFLSFSSYEWAKMYPHLLLNSGEKKEIDLTLSENSV